MTNASPDAVHVLLSSFGKLYQAVLETQILAIIQYLYFVFWMLTVLVAL